MKNETQNNGAKSLKQELPTRDPRQQEEPKALNHPARRRSLVTQYTLPYLDGHLQLDWIRLINGPDAWEEPIPPKRKETTIDPREFLGTAPPFSWE